MSSFQLWDLEKSPHVAVVGTIEPDHLNVHNGFDDYINAKANICRHQTESDYTIYYEKNPDSVKIATNGNGKKITYPFPIPEEIKNAIRIPGAHNIENAIAAIGAVASFYDLTPEDFIAKNQDNITKGLSSFTGLPHRLEFVREFGKIKVYDDNFSTNPASTRVAVNAFPDDDVVIIAGGRDKTDNADLPEIYEVITASNIKKIILMGESGHELAKRYHDDRFTVVESLEEAVESAVKTAENLDRPVVLMSPSAASFDMFENVYDRGSKFQDLIRHLS